MFLPSHGVHGVLVIAILANSQSWDWEICNPGIPFQD